MNKKKELIDKINKLQQRITSHDYQIGELQNLVENLANLPKFKINDKVKIKFIETPIYYTSIHNNSVNMDYSNQIGKSILPANIKEEHKDSIYKVLSIEKRKNCQRFYAIVSCTTDDIYSYIIEENYLEIVK